MLNRPIPLMHSGLEHLIDLPMSLARLLGNAHDPRAIEPLKRAVVLDYARGSLLEYRARQALASLGEFRMRRIW